MFSNFFVKPFTIYFPSRRTPFSFLIVVCGFLYSVPDILLTLFQNSCGSVVFSAFSINMSQFLIFSFWYSSLSWCSVSWYVLLVIGLLPLLLCCCARYYCRISFNLFMVLFSLIPGIVLYLIVGV